MRSSRIVGIGVAALICGAVLSAAGQGGQKSGTSKPKQEIYVSVASDMSKVEVDGTTPLHRAVLTGDLVKMQALVKAGANVRAATRYGVTPASIAAMNGDAPMMEALLKAGADPNSTTGEGETVLMRAARTGNAAVVRTLIAHGANVNAKEGWFQQTALMWAAAQNHPEAAEVLINAGADLNARAALPDPAVRPRDGNDGCGQCTHPSGGLTPLLYAAREGSLDAVRVLADAHADLNLGDPDNIPPLVIALINGHYDVAALLLEKGANPNAVDKTGRGPLFVATDMHTLEYRFNRPDPKFTDRLTPLDLIKMLLERGADVNQALNTRIVAPKNSAAGNGNLTAGSTPFLKAATTDDVDVMRLLLIDWGADPYVTNQVHSNALMIAAGLGWRPIGSRGTQEEAIEAVTLCLELGMNINAANDNGDTALHGAAQRTEDQDANKIIQFLVDHGANLYAKNKLNRTPFNEANGELVTAPGGTPRGINHRSVELLQTLMKTHPDPAPGSSLGAVTPTKSEGEGK